MPSSLSCICHGCLLDPECRWRHNRPGVLTDAQYQAAKEIALSYIPRFFPGNATKPVFVPLLANVATKLNDLQEELKDGHPPPAADEKVPGAAAEEVDHPRPHDPETEAEHQQREPVQLSPLLPLHLGHRQPVLLLFLFSSISTQGLT